MARPKTTTRKPSGRGRAPLVKRKGPTARAAPLTPHDGSESSRRKKLAVYDAKRDFDVTSEPSSTSAVKSAADGERATFMIHKHDATRLHYDIRLETEGVLASWACPKGPSYDPSQKRLAVETEDHPLAYGAFEGRIPDGQYGAGDSLIWDRGTYDTQPAGQMIAQRKKGHIHVVFDGQKLKGGWHLVRTRPQGSKSQWLCFKVKDGTERAGYDVVAERPESVKSGRSVTRGPERMTVATTHPQKVMFPKLGYTKADVREYIDVVAGPMVKALLGRPLSFQQFPQGIEGHSFFRHNAATSPAWVTKATVIHNEKNIEQLIVDKPETLWWLANQNALTLHMPSSRVSSLDEPDWVAFDFDPVEGGFKEMIELVTALHGILEQLKLPSVPKTSGKRGLHVLVPIAQGHTHEQAAGFANAVSAVLAQRFSKIATTERMIRERHERLYIDAGQNGRLKTMVAPYTMRAVEAASVSTPLAWDEVTQKLDPQQFTLKTLPKRLATVGDLFEPALRGMVRLPMLR